MDLQVSPFHSFIRPSEHDLIETFTFFHSHGFQCLRHQAVITKMNLSSQDRTQNLNEILGDFGVEEMQSQPVSALDVSRTGMGRTRRRYMYHMYVEPQVRLALTRVPPS